MKVYICIAAGIAWLFTSCNNLETYFQTAKSTKKDTTVAITNTPVVARDTSLTPAVAYNDIFLDTASVENFIRKEGLSEAEARDLRNFYNQRNYQFAWLYSDGFTESSRNFWNLYTSDSTRLGKNEKQQQFFTFIDTLIARDSFQVRSTDSTLLTTELTLSRRFIPFARTALANIPALLLLPTRKLTTQQWVDTILQSNFAINNDTTQSPYFKLSKVLQQYTTMAKQGAWQPIAVSKTWQPGSRSPELTAIKKRLQVLGVYTNNDTTAVYNDSLKVAVQKIQQQNGLQANGIIGDSLIRILNVPVEQRMQQLIVNMCRMLWLKQPDTNCIEVNIPEFMLHVHKGDSTVLSMPVVVGKEGTGTVLFTGNMNQLVFNPYWNIPPGIIQNEILPATKQNPDYLKTHHMEVVRQGDSLPVIRQLPGADNALGKVKFLFPNRWDIYFHDTPDKDLFSQHNRALSHGCIRLADAEQLADYVLRDDPKWTPEKIHQAMNSSKEQNVKLKTPVAVVISYYTAWVDSQGQLHFRDDVYGKDKRAAGMLFLQNGVA